MLTVMTVSRPTTFHSVRQRYCFGVEEAVIPGYTHRPRYEKAEQADAPGPATKMPRFEQGNKRGGVALGPPRYLKVLGSLCTINQ